MEKKDLKKGMKLRFVQNIENFKKGTIVTFDGFDEDAKECDNNYYYDISILEDSKTYHSFIEFEIVPLGLDYFKNLVLEKQQEKSKIDDEISEIEKKIKYLEDNNLKEYDETLLKATEIYYFLKNDNLTENQKIEFISNILTK